MRIVSLVSVLLLTTVLSVAQAAKQDISGLYSFVHNPETVQINVQPDGSVNGYVSHLADGDADRGQMLDMMFEHASLHGNHLEFKTKKVHGVWFEFKGEVQRGKAQSHDAEGYYLIRGTLTTVREDVSGKPTPMASEVEFKSFPAGM
jgi:hypothetical protein